MSVRAHVVDSIRRGLKDRQIVVWFDPDGSFSELVDGFEIEDGVKVLDGRESVYEARRSANHRC